jgi:spermidine/putrescine transport system substrate-binding protein
MDDRRTDPFLDGRLSRRDLLRLAGGAGATLFLAACGGAAATSAPTTAATAVATAVATAAGAKDVGPAPRKIGGELNLLTWAGYDDTAILAEFQEIYGVKINAKQHSGDEELMSIFSASKPGDWDVGVPDTPWIEIFKNNGWIAELDPADFPLGDYFTQFQKFDQCYVDGKMHGIVSRWGYYGIAYNSKYVKADEATTSEVLFNPKYKGKVVLFDWYLPNMGMIGRLLGIKQPYDATTAELDQIKKKLFELRPQVGAIQATASDTIAAMASETGWLSFASEWAPVTLKEQGIQVEMTVPKEGGVSWTEGMVIFKEGKNQEAAQAYLQYMSSAKGSAKLAWAQAFHAKVPNKRSVEYLQPDQAKTLELNDMATVEAILPNIATRKIPPDEKAWQDIWDEFKAL